MKMEELEIIKVNDINELNECLKIRNEVFTLEQNVVKEIEVDEYDSLNKDCTHFLVKYQNKCIGTLRGQNKSDNTIKLQRFCFLKEYRKMGFGKKVLQFVEDYYRNLNKKTIKLDAQYHVYKFYKICGYKEVSDIFIEAGIKHIKMVKNL